MYNYKKQLLEKIIDKEQIDGVVEPKVAPAAKYKQLNSFDPPHRPDIYPGKKVIFPLSDENTTWKNRGINGYALGVIIDYEENRGRWFDDSQGIIQIIIVSNEKFADRVGRLTWLYLSNRKSYYDKHSGARLVPEEGKPSDYKL